MTRLDTRIDLDLADLLQVVTIAQDQQLNFADSLEAMHKPDPDQIRRSVREGADKSVLIIRRLRNLMKELELIRNEVAELELERSELYVAAYGVRS